MNFVPIKMKIFKGGNAPSYTREDDSCLDCQARLEADVVIPSGERRQVPLGFAISCEEGWEIQIRPRSGLTKRGIDIGFGTGEASYRGEYQATVINNSGEDFVVHNGDRICQMTVKPKYTVMCQIVGELPFSQRGENGFGSSGV